MRTAGVVLFAALAGAPVGCDRAAPAPAPAPEPAPPRAQTDKERLQGVWAIESIDTGDPKLKLPEDFKKLRYQFRGDRIDTGLAGKFRRYAAVEVNDRTDPKVLTVTLLDLAGKPFRPEGTFQAHPREWLYKFDGDTLVLAKADAAVFAEKPPARPTGFEPKLPDKTGGGVTVLRLKKTADPVTDPTPPQTPGK